MRCVVPGCDHCSSRASSRGITFHKFPSNASLRALWLAALGGPVRRPRAGAVCSMHFLAADLRALSAGGRRLRPGAVPLVKPQVKQEPLNSTDDDTCLFDGNSVIPDNTTDLHDLIEYTNEENVDTIDQKQDMKHQSNGISIKVEVEDREDDKIDNDIPENTVLEYVKVENKYLDYLSYLNVDTAVGDIKVVEHGVTFPDRHDKMDIKVERDDPDSKNSCNGKALSDATGCSSTFGGDGYSTDVGQARGEADSHKRVRKVKQTVEIPQGSSQPEHHSTTRIGTHSVAKPYACDVCEKSFSSKSHLTAHLKLHSGEKPYLCDVCTKSFIRNSDLIIHFRTHSGEKPYSCDLCTKSFGHKSNFIAHLRIHSGNKPYSCGVCSKSFINKTLLTGHMRVHSGERPFSCDLCPRTFARKKYLTIHLTSHFGDRPYSCNLCTKSFSQKRYLKIHYLRIHSGEKPFTCDVPTKPLDPKSITVFPPKSKKRLKVLN